jgi:mRNA interferase MazF
VNRGEVRWYTFHPPDKRRPVLILTRNSAIHVLTGITVAPITSTIRHIPTEVVLTPEDDGVLIQSAVSLDNILTVPKAKLGGLVAVLSRPKMAAVARAIRFALELD